VNIDSEFVSSSLCDSQQEHFAYFRRYCGVSINCKTRANRAAALLIRQSSLFGPSSRTMISATLKMAQALAIWPASKVPSSWPCAFSMHEAPIAIEIDFVSLDRI